jgi:HK97 gp10 family phage protein
MAGAGVEVDARGLAPAMADLMSEDKRLLEEMLLHLGEEIASRARTLAPKRTGRLAASIAVSALRRGRSGPEITVGAEAREAFFMEFGTYKDRPQPFMRPAVAAALGGLRGAGYAVRVSGNNRARLIARRARARVVVHRRRRRGELTAGEARSASRDISSKLRFRSKRRRRF